MPDCSRTTICCELAPVNMAYTLELGTVPMDNKVNTTKHKLRTEVR